MSARETRGKNLHGARGRVAAPTRHIPANPEALTLRDIPAVLKPGEQSQTAKPHFTVPKHPAAPVKQTPEAPLTSDEPVVDPDVLAKQRAALGFDDIPLVSAEELENEKALRAKVGSWAKEAYRHSVAPAKRQRVGRFFKDKEFLNWKDDLKWALRADSEDEPNEPENPNKSGQPQPPANVVADQQPRRIRVPQRGPQFTAGLREQARLQQQQLTMQPVTPAAANTKTIDIKISIDSLPKLPKLPKLPSIKPLLGDIRHLRWNRRTQIVTGILVVLALFVAPHFLFGASNDDANSDTTGSVVTQKISQKPTYKTMVPSGVSASTISWQRVSPPGSNPVYAYADTIDGVGVDVSQQPVPNGWKPDVQDRVATLAKSYNASVKITAGSTTVYVGTSSQGPQSVIFTKNNLLVLIKSTGNIPASGWANYAKSLN